MLNKHEVLGTLISIEKQDYVVYDSYSELGISSEFGATTFFLIKIVTLVYMLDSKIDF
jgi:hypothetical protein